MLKLETDINIRLGKAATVFWQLNVKLKLYMSTVVAMPVGHGKAQPGYSID